MRLHDVHRFLSDLKSQRPWARAAPPCVGCGDRVGRPSSVEPRMGFTLGDDVVVVPIPDAWGAVVDAELALLDRSSRRATLLNASAALIYTAFDGERPLHAVIDQLVGETGGDRASIARDVESTVARLVAAGIVDVGAPVADPPSDDPGAGAPEDGDPGREGDPEQIHEEHLAEHGPWALARDLTVGGTTCRLRVDDASLAEVVGPLVSSLPEAPADGTRPHDVARDPRPSRRRSFPVGGRRTGRHRRCRP